MKKREVNFYSVEGFNKSVQYVKIVNFTHKYLQQGFNFADIFFEVQKKKKVSQEQITWLVKLILMDKYQYIGRTFNLQNEIFNFQELKRVIKQCEDFDIVLMYHHPVIGIILLNGFNEELWKEVENFDINQFLVVYVKPLKKGLEKRVDDFFEHFSDFIQEDKKFIKKFSSGTSNYKSLTNDRKDIAQAPTTTPTPTTPTPTTTDIKKEDKEKQVVDREEKTQMSTSVPKNIKSTPRYSVQVTNELFHNGNVEAWKNIVESYEKSHPTLNVQIFHEGQHIKNINALFKWGKVKNGDVILFSIVGNDFKDISKLQRYLFEGASNRFQIFLKKDLNRELILFR